MSDPRSAFNWARDPRPSIFATDIAFTGSKKTGKSLNQTATESVEKVTKRDGRNPGSIRGISAAGNLLIEESEHKARRAARG